MMINAKEKKLYRMKKTVEAVQIDAQWLQFLIKEKKMDEANIGDYFVVGLDGESIWPRKGFEAVFEAV